MPEILKSNYDPTGTTHLRNEFSDEIFRRWESLRLDLGVLAAISIYEPCPDTIGNEVLLTSGFDDTVERVIRDHVEGTTVEFADPRPYIAEQVRKEADRLVKVGGFEIVDDSTYFSILKSALFLRPNEYLLANPEIFICIPNDRRVEVFLAWLKARIRDYILDNFLTLPETMEILSGADISEVNWTDNYIDQAYIQGVYDAALALQEAGYPLDTPSQAGRLGEIIDDGVKLGALPLAHNQLLKSLRRGTYDDVTALASNFETDISKIVSRGLSQGLSSDEIAGNIEYLISHRGEHTGIVDTLGRRYSTFDIAQQIARTEIVRTYNEAALEMYVTFGVVEVMADIEFVFTTQGDNLVCPQCRSLEGGTYTIEEARGVLPIHRNCRCFWRPKFRRLI